MIEFSVLMSIYHKEKPEYFDKCLESILVNQTLLPNEVVLICDGPLTIDLDHIVEKYQSKYNDILKVFRLEKNGGLGNALRFGIEKCSYAYIARMDTDDICFAERFEKQVKFIQDNSDVICVGSDVAEFLENPNDITAYKRMPHSYEEVKKWSRFRNPMSHQTVFFKKEEVLAVGSYIELHYLEDYYLWIRLLANGYKLANINEPLVYYRSGAGVLSRRSDKSYVANWRVLNSYMLKKKMIGVTTYLRNMCMVRAFIYSPTLLRKIAYKTVLRSRK
jgi:glycosyltransferase involved in cell wall biosynthesis